MTYDIYISLKVSEKEEKKIEKALANGYDSKSKYIRDCINNYDVNIEEIKLRAELKGYNMCVAELTTNKEMVLQKLEKIGGKVTQNNESNTTQADKCYQVTPNTLENTQKVTQSNTNFTESQGKVTQNQYEENRVTPENNTNPTESQGKVTHITDNPRYELYKPYLPMLSRCLNMTGSVDKKIKERISNDTNTKPSQVGAFIYEFSDEIKEVPYDMDGRTIHEKTPK